jgi:hypothetical protein
MAHPKLTVDTFDGSPKVTVEGLLQMTVLSDGSVQIDLAGKHIEVNRKGLQYLVRPENDALVLSPEFEVAAGHGIPLLPLPTGSPA